MILTLSTQVALPSLISLTGFWKSDKIVGLLKTSKGSQTFIDLDIYEYEWYMNIIYNTGIQPTQSYIEMPPCMLS